MKIISKMTLNNYLVFSELLRPKGRGFHLFIKLLLNFLIISAKTINDY
jgi:hypothetical protein